jgi:hypothetical protein
LRSALSRFRRCFRTIHLLDSFRRSYPFPERTAPGDCRHFARGFRALSRTRFCR